MVEARPMVVTGPKNAIGMKEEALPNTNAVYKAKKVADDKTALYVVGKSAPEVAVAPALEVGIAPEPVENILVETTPMEVSAGEVLFPNAPAPTNAAALATAMEEPVVVQEVAQPNTHSQNIIDFYAAKERYEARQAQRAAEDAADIAVMEAAILAEQTKNQTQGQELVAVPTQEVVAAAPVTPDFQPFAPAPASENMFDTPVAPVVEEPVFAEVQPVQAPPAPVVNNLVHMPPPVVPSVPTNLGMSA